MAPSIEREVPVRALNLERREADPARRVPGRVRRAQALGNPDGVRVTENVSGFTIDSLEAAIVNLKSQGHASNTPLVAKVADHPLGADYPEARLVGFLAIVSAPPEAPAAGAQG